MFMKNESTQIKISKRLKALRLERHMLQVDLAVAANINPNHYSKIESGKVNLHFKTLVNLAKALKLHTHDLLPY